MLCTPRRAACGEDLLVAVQQMVGTRPSVFHTQDPHTGDRPAATERRNEIKKKKVLATFCVCVVAAWLAVILLSSTQAVIHPREAVPPPPPLGSSFREKLIYPKIPLLLPAVRLHSKRI